MKHILLILFLLISSNGQADIARFKYMSYLLFLTNQHIAENIIHAYYENDPTKLATTFRGLCSAPVLATLPTHSFFVRPDIHETVDSAVTISAYFVSFISFDLFNQYFSTLSSTQLFYYHISLYKTDLFEFMKHRPLNIR